MPAHSILPTRHSVQKGSGKSDCRPMMLLYERSGRPCKERGKKMVCCRAMTEVSPAELKKAIESQHGGVATFVQSVPVHETYAGETVWDGTVSVFQLFGHKKAETAYAWSHELPDGKRRFFAVLRVPPIDSPAAAVRAAIVAEHGHPRR